MENLQTKVNKESKYDLPPTLIDSKAPIKGEKYSLFVEQYLEPMVYKGDAQMLTIPSASSFRGIPLLDDF